MTHKSNTDKCVIAFHHIIIPNTESSIPYSTFEFIVPSYDTLLKRLLLSDGKKALDCVVVRDLKKKKQKKKREFGPYKTISIGVFPIT